MLGGMGMDQLMEALEVLTLAEVVAGCPSLLGLLVLEDLEL
jgi:hypothetical protein